MKDFNKFKEKTGFAAFVIVALVTQVLVVAGEARAQSAASPLTLSLSQDTIPEGGEAILTATLERVRPEEVTVTLAITRGRHVFSSDFSLEEETLIIPAGVTTAATTIAAVNDPYAEGDEEIVISASGVSPEPEPVTLTITSEDLVKIEFDTPNDPDASVREGGTANLEFYYDYDGYLAPARDFPFRVEVSLRDGSVIERDVIFPANTREMLFPLDPFLADNNGDDRQSFIALRVLPSPGLYAADPTHVFRLKVIDNDPTLALTPDIISEDGGVSRVAVVLSEAASEDTRVALTVTPEGHATADDVVLGATTLTIPAGFVAATTTITGVANDVDTADKTFTVSATLTTGDFTRSDSAVLTVSDNDLPVVTISGQASAVEGSTENAEFVLTRTGDLTEKLDVLLETINRAGEKYRQPFPFRFRKGEPANPIALPYFFFDDDEINNGPTNVVFRVLPDPAYEVGFPGVYRLNIIDNEASAPTLVLSPPEISERGGRAMVSLALPAPAVETTTVPVVASGASTAADTRDYTVAGGMNFTVEAGETMSSNAITFTAVNNETDDPADKTIVLQTRAVGALPASGQSILTIVDDDNLLPVVDVTAPASVAEGKNVNFEFTRTGNITAALSVRIEVIGRGQEITGREITFAAGSATAAYQTIAAQNSLEDGLTTLSARVLAGADYTAGVPGFARVEIVDNEPVTPTLGLSSTTISERGGAATLRAVLRGPAPRDFTVEIRVGDRERGTLDDVFVDGEDALRAGLRFLEGAFLSSNSITLAARNNSEAGADTTVILYPVIGAQAFHAQSVFLTVTDDERPVVTVGGPNLVTESGDNSSAARAAGDFTITRTGDTAKALNVAAVTTGTDDKKAPATITIGIGERMVTYPFATLTGFADDTDTGAGEVSLRLTPDAAYEIGAAGYHSVTIIDDDAAADAPPVLAVSPGKISENNGSAEVKLVLPGAAASPTTIALEVGGASTAVENADYTISGTSFTIARGATESDAVTITAVNNDADVADKTIVLQTRAEGAVVASEAVTLTILDDDPPTVSVTGPASVTEGETAAFTLVRAGFNGEALTTRVEIADRAGVASTMDVVFAAGADTAPLPLPVAQNGVYDGPTTLSVRVLAHADYYEVGAPAAHRVDVVDDEIPLTLTLEPDLISEHGGETTLTVRLPGATPRDVTIDLEITRGQGVTTHDYAISGTTLTIPAPFASARATIAALDDDAVQGRDKTLTILARVSGGEVASTPVTLTITDDEASLSLRRPDNLIRTAGRALSVILPAATGAGEMVTYALSGLPPGLDFDPAKRELFGTPTEAGETMLTYTATESDTTRQVTFPVVIQLALAETKGRLAVGELQYKELPVTFPEVIAGASGAVTYALTLGSGQPLPAWLMFDPNDRTLNADLDQAEGRLDLLYTATDQATPPNVVTLRLNVDQAVQPVTDDEEGRPFAFITNHVGATSLHHHLSIVVVFSEQVEGFEASDVEVNNGTLDPDSLEELDAQSSSYIPASLYLPQYRLEVSPDGGGDVGITVREGAATDDDGNLSKVAHLTVPFDSTPPTVELRRDGSGTENGLFNISVIASEPIRSFTKSELIVTGGRVVAFGPTFSGAGTFREWTVPILPDDDLQGMVTIELEDRAARDFAYNRTSTVVLNVPVDTLEPTPALTRAGTGVETGSFTVTITFAEEVEALEHSDLLLEGGTVSSFTAGADNRVWTAEITPATDRAGTLTVSLAEGATADRAGNSSRAAQLPVPFDSRTSDAPYITSITRMNPHNERTRAETLQWRVVFSEAVYGVSGDDFAVRVVGGEPVQATLGHSGDDGADTYVVSAGAIALANGEVGLALSNGHGIDDMDDNALIGGLPDGAETYTLDTTPPVVESIVRANPLNELTDLSPLIWRVTFSEEVTGVDADGSDFRLTETLPAPDSTWRLESAVTADGGRSWLVTITGRRFSDVHRFALSLAPDGTVSDVAGNELVDRNVAGASEMYHYDNSRPVVTISIDDRDNNTFLSGGETILFRFHDSDVIGFGDEDVIISVLYSQNNSSDPGTLGPLRVDPDDTRIYRAEFIRSPTFHSGLVEFSITSTSAGDPVGNPIRTARAQFVILPPPGESAGTRDTIAPTIRSVTRTNPPANDEAASVARINRIPANELTGGAVELNWRVVFSEDVIDVSNDDFTLFLVNDDTGRTEVKSEVKVGGVGDTYLVSANGGDIETGNGWIGLALTGNHLIKDGADNLLEGGLPRDAETYLLDNTPPVLLTVTRDPASLQYTGADELRWYLNFSEAVADVNPEDIELALTEGPSGVDVAISHETGSSTVLATAAGGDLGAYSGEVMLDLTTSGVKFQDLVGNGIEKLLPEGYSESYILNGGAPALTDIQSSAPYNVLGGGLEATLTFIFSEPVFDFDASDINVGPMNAGVISNFSGDPGSVEYTAVFTADTVFHGDVLIIVNHNSFVDTDGEQGIGYGIIFAINNQSPRIVSVAAADNVFGAQDTLVWNIVFSEPVTLPPEPADVLRINPDLTPDQRFMDSEDSVSFLYFLRGGDLVNYIGTVGIEANPERLALIVDQNGNPLVGGFPDNPPTITLTNIQFGLHAPSATFMAGEEIPYFQLPEVTGAVGTVVYTLTGPGGGGLPEGLEFHPSARMLSGTPTIAGKTMLTYTATDSTVTDDKMSFSVNIEMALGRVSDPALASALERGGAVRFEDLPVEFPAVAAGAVGGVTYELTVGPEGGSKFAALATGAGDSLPGWLRFDSTRRTLTLVDPDQATGTLVLNYIATDSAAPTANTAGINVLFGGNPGRREGRLTELLGAVGRTLGWGIAETIRERTRSARSGEPVRLSGVSEDTSLEDLIAAGASFDMALNDPAGAGPGNRESAGRLWARVGRSDFDSQPLNDYDQDGSLTSLHAGVDFQSAPDRLFGAAIGWHDAQVGYDDRDADVKGDLELEIVTVNPYASRTLDRWHAWGTAGYGIGEMTYTEESREGAGETSQSDVTLWNAAGGLEYAVGNIGAADLTARGDGMLLRMNTAGTNNQRLDFGDLRTDVYGLRGEVEMGLPMARDNIGTLRPFAVLGARWDGGDDAAGGVSGEYGGGIVARNRHLSVDASLRSRFGSGDETPDVTSWSVSLGYDANNDDRGLALELNHKAGPQPWDPFAGNGFTTASVAPADLAPSLDATTRYGMDYRNGRMTPYNTLRFAGGLLIEVETGINYRLSGLDFSLNHVYKPGTDSGDSDAHSLKLIGRISF